MHTQCAPLNSIKIHPKIKTLSPQNSFQIEILTVSHEIMEKVCQKIRSLGYSNTKMDIRFDNFITQEEKMGTCTSSEDIKTSVKRQPKGKYDASLRATSTSITAVKEEPSKLSLTASTESRMTTQNALQRQSSLNKSELEPVLEPLHLASVIFEMDLDSDQLDEKLSEMVQDLFDKYDKDNKGFLDLNEFQVLVKTHASNTDAKVSEVLGIKEEVNDVSVHKWELFTILRESVRC